MSQSKTEEELALSFWFDHAVKKLKVNQSSLFENNGSTRIANAFYQGYRPSLN